MVLAISPVVTGLLIDGAIGGNGESSAALAGLLVTGAVFLGLFVPSLAAIARRLHDTGKSSKWYFVSFIPWIGSLIILALLLPDSEHGPNRFGPDPKSGTR